MLLKDNAVGAIQHTVNPSPANITKPLQNMTQIKLGYLRPSAACTTEIRSLKHLANLIYAALFRPSKA